MRNYEVVLIIHPEQDEAAFNEMLERVQGWITDGGGKVEKVDLWGKRRLAYPIQKLNDGQYALLHTEMDPNFCTELERNLRLQETILRYLIKVKES